VVYLWRALRPNENMVTPSRPVASIVEACGRAEDWLSDSPLGVVVVYASTSSRSHPWRLLQIGMLDSTGQVMWADVDNGRVASR
jgi:hypothetical protein